MASRGAISRSGHRCAGWIDEHLRNDSTLPSIANPSRAGPQAGTRAVPPATTCAGYSPLAVAGRNQGLLISAKVSENARKICCFCSSLRSAAIAPLQRSASEAQPILSEASVYWFRATLTSRVNAAARARYSLRWRHVQQTPPSARHRS